MMQCPHCGTELTNPGILCPKCGGTLTPPSEEKPQAGHPAHHLSQKMLIPAIALFVFIAAVAASAYTGLYLGERDREAQWSTLADEHYQAGIQALNNGQYEIARAHFQYVLQLDGDYPQAQQGLDEAAARIATKPTPTEETGVPLVDNLMAQAEAAYQAQDWTAAASTFTQLRALDKDYQPDKVEPMLFTSLYNAGLAYLEADEMEKGIFYLDQAVALRPLDTEAVRQRDLAARYQDTLRYWGVDWEKAISELEALYALAPDYKDVLRRLYQANIEYADSQHAAGEMCPAELAYTRALRISTDPQVEQKRAEAAQLCLIATPMPLDGGQPMLTPQAIPGFTTGRLAYPVYNSDMGYYDLYALYANGRILRVAQNSDQPWWEQGTGRVIYRDRVSGAISMVLPEEGVPLLIFPPETRAWPTLSPDGQRIAYSAPGADGNWYIYIVNTDGTGEPRQLAWGWSPAWGPSGLLAYTGCKSDTDCGIVIDNPDDGQPGTLLTHNIDDTAPSWAPGGNLLAYMTNITGNWDVMLLDTGGGVTQFTYEITDEGLPVWAPDGSGVAFVSNRGGKWAIYIADPNGQNVRRVIDLGMEMPAWDNQRLSWAP